MRFLKIIILLCISVLSIFGFGNLSLATSNNSYLSNNVEEQIKIREEYGLETTFDLLTKLQKLPAKDGYGIPLTENEVQELQEREKFSDVHIPHILEELRGESPFSKIGTFYRDNRDNGRLMVGLVKNTEIKDEVIQRIKSKVPIHAQDKIKFLDVTYSESDLNQIILNIFDDRELLEDKGVSVTEAFEDVRGNKVSVGIYPYTEEAATIIKDRYGADAVTVIEKEVEKLEDRSANYYYMYGGIRIAGTAANSTGSQGGCSAGFSIENARGNFLVTAGHCTNDWTGFYQGGYYKGSIYDTNEGGSADVGVISLFSNRTTNDIYRYSYGDRALTSYQGVTEDYVGQSVAKVGIATDLTSGTIQSRNWHGDFENGIHYTYLRDASYASSGGDSGGTVYWGSELRGIHTGSNGKFSHIYYVNQKTPGLPKLN